ncbi:MAG: Uma2 family endonuclease [Planctomycetales bacterium]|nr:Uma2 family endonuclease [Planctomycetales bacterium]
MSLTTSPSKFGNLAELIDSLGGVPLERIRVAPPLGAGTIDDIVNIEEKEGRLCEMIDGVLVEKTMGYFESEIAVLLAAALIQFVKKNDLGVVTGEGGMILFPGNQVRIPDVAFVSWERFLEAEAEGQSVPELVPDLAVEVLSPSNSAGEMSIKLEVYFRAGVRLVWYVDPASKSVTVYTSLTRSKVVPLEGTLDGGKVLPGFELPVRDLFAVKKSRSNKNGHRGKR